MSSINVPTVGQTAPAADKSTGGRHLPYAAGLDGLRALAVLAVVLYHAGLNWFRGGFLGVEVFFVISGYLITSLLYGEWERKGTIDLKAFWLRRARRLLAALFATLFVTLAFTVIFLPNEVATLRKDVLAATFYITNWFLIIDKKSYFEAIGRPSALQHLWSLAVEEQFYIFWPIFSLVVFRRLRRRIVLTIVLALAAASSALMALLYVPDVDPSRIYYGTDTRATGLLIGAGLALMWRPWVHESYGRRAITAALEAVGLAAILGIVAFCVLVGEYNPFLYQGGFALISLVTAVAIAAVVYPAAHLGRWGMGRQPMLWIGQRSYSIYLWHWPVFTYSRPQLDLPLDGLPLLVLRLAATALLAELSFRFVERPVRDGALGNAWRALRESSGARRRELMVRWSGTVGALAVCVVGLGITAAGAKLPPPPDYLAVGAINTIGGAGAATVGSASPAKHMPTGVSDSTSTAVQQGTQPGPVAKALAKVGSTPSSAPFRGGTKLISGLASPIANGPPLSLATSNVIASNANAIHDNGTTAGQSTAGGAESGSQRAVGSQAAVSAVSAPAPSGTAGKVTVVGDSVVLSAWAAVHQVPNLQVDGKVNRQAAETIEVLQADINDGSLSQTVVIDIGNNGPFSAREFDEIMGVLGSQRRVIFMTVRVPRPWEAPNNAVIAEGVKRYPNAELLDWHAASEGHPEWLRNDGIHTSGDGAKAYARLIAAATGLLGEQR